MLTPASRSMRMACVTSSSVSPRPTMILDLMRMSGRSRRASRRTASDCSNEARGSRTTESSRGTHSTLCANTLRGRSSRSAASASRLPSRSEHSSSKPTSGLRWLTARIQSR